MQECGIQCQEIKDRIPEKPQKTQVMSSWDGEAGIQLLCLAGGKNAVTGTLGRPETLAIL